MKLLGSSLSNAPSRLLIEILVTTMRVIYPSIHPFCIGRRNWLFADTVAGAQFYSLIETAKANALEPYVYLRHVFTELPKAQSLDEVEALLPTGSTPPPSLDTHPKAPGTLINPRQ